ncbi:MAG: hypothetical protein NT144_05715 [Bacteroidia bacterium]|nr:hypothetical protein [Bacteroidia bacterium]
MFDNSDKPPVFNNPDLVMTSIKSMKSILGENNVKLVETLTVAEDFGKYGLTEEKVPIALF